MCFSIRICPPQKYHVWFKAAPRYCGICSKLSLNAENLSYIISETVACARMHVYAYACFMHVYTELEHACAYMYTCTHALGFPWSFFSKNNLFCPKISYIFHILFSSQFSSNQAINQP